MMGFVEGIRINGHFISINISRAGQAMNSTPAAIPIRCTSP